MKKKVLVSRVIFPEVLARLKEEFDVDASTAAAPLARAELVARLQGCRGVITTGSERIDAELIAQCPELRAVCNMAVGYNNIDLAACTAAGIVCTNTPDVLTETTADFGFALMMATARRITESEQLLRRGEWKHWAYDMMTGPDVHGATLGILGMGRIGQSIARRGAFGFGMKVIYHNRSRLDAATESACGASYVGKEQLLREADHLVLVLPYTPASHHVIAAAELALMKPTATLTNIARGGIVDENALADVLAAGRLAGAGLDVFEGEPTINPKLLALKNVVLTPHIASASITTRRAMADLAADNLIAAMGQGPQAGKPPSVLNPEVVVRPA
ncbi:D-glycerate dehydrogenase [soil metagenome]